MLLEDSVRGLKGVGPKKAEYLANLGIRTVRDLLYHFPRSFADRSRVMPLMHCPDGEKATVRVVVEAIRGTSGYQHRSPMKLSVSDETGKGEVVFFNAAYLKNTFAVGESYCFYGPIQRRGRTITLQHPEFCSREEWDRFSKLTPVYPLSAGLTQNDIRALVGEALKRIRLSETLPDLVVSDLNLVPLETAMTTMHWPENLARWHEARRRFAFEELFSVQLALLMIRKGCSQSGKTCRVASEHTVETFLKTLPFVLTDSQKQVMGVIEADLKGERVMNRLVQGDVGSGKTVLAVASSWLYSQNGCQTAVMVPTDILARQHFKTFSEWLKPRGIGVELLTGSSKDRSGALERIRSGESSVVVGTHALIQETVEFHQLGLVVTDEQHRFGVRQRGMLSHKGTAPDVLFMSATPIPRTLSLVLYGDVDVSFITEMPKGRLPVKTHYIKESKRNDMYRFIRERLDAGEQAYMVCPLVADSEQLEAKSAESLYDTLRLGPLKGYSVGLLHGQMKSSEKETVMGAFAERHYGVLVSTTVIEVGVDVPNSTVMVIEDAQRFGLAQLHQLRGRVGRGSGQSWCFLMSPSPGEIARQRIQTLTETNDGMVIAQKDLELRGPGEIVGTRQHGIPELKVANLFEDHDLLQQAQEWAVRITRDETLLQAAIGCVTVLTDRFSV